jgi:hypothetical protein
VVGVAIVQTLESPFRSTIEEFSDAAGVCRCHCRAYRVRGR